MKVHEQRDSQARRISEALTLINDMRAHLCIEKFTAEIAGDLRNYININEVDVCLLDIRDKLEDMGQ